MNKKNTVLIVDDIPINIQLVAQHLKPLGYKMLFATSGDNALSILYQNPVDLILLDVMMPLMNGYETCRKIRSRSEWADIPVIFLTARNEAIDIVKGFEAGGSDYITKPFYGQELLERVKTQLELKNQRDQLEKNQLQLKELLHILSHDLRNSFSGISMIMDLAELEGKSIEVYKDRLKDLNLNGLNILDLVSTMLELEGKPLTLGSVNLNECLEHTIELMKPRFKEKNIALKLDLEENTIVLAEKTSLINSVLMNILTNALKFSFKGGEVSISIRTKNFLVTLGIEDSGIGISESQILHLFNVRKGISRPGTSGEKGSGFGLPLAWKFMQAYGGEINVISGEKKAEDHPGGTRIILSFLLAQSLEEKA